ncbi:GNAT family N-acetyltransferase [Nocardioides luteus]
MNVVKGAGEEIALVAAGIWAEATAKRDGFATTAPAEAKLPGIRRALDAGGTIQMAYDGDQPIGFALLVPGRGVLELRYFAVASEAWGTGVASELMAALVDRARASDVTVLELWVLQVNARAIAFYERSGWRTTPDLKSQVDSRRIERRLERILTVST